MVRRDLPLVAYVRNREIDLRLAMRVDEESTCWIWSYVCSLPAGNAIAKANRFRCMLYSPTLVETTSE